VIHPGAGVAVPGDVLHENHHMSKRRFPAVLALALTAGAISASGAAGAPTKTVTLKNIAFSPKSLTVSKGTKVTFAFRDNGTTHNVKSTGAKRFKTITDRSSGSQSRTFSSAGTYRYVCTLHPGMSGRITVR
jgi:plastocyanin